MANFPLIGKFDLLMTDHVSVCTLKSIEDLQSSLGGKVTHAEYQVTCELSLSRARIFRGQYCAQAGDRGTNSLYNYDIAFVF